MNRRNLLFVLLLFVMLSLSSTVVHAEGLTDVFRNMGEFIFEDVPSMGDMGFRFLLWLALFSIFYTALKTKFEPRMSGIVSFVLSTGVAIMIGGQAVLTLFRLYSQIIMILLGIVVPVFLIWRIHSAIENQFLRGLLYFLCGISLVWFTNNASTLLATAG